MLDSVRALGVCEFTVLALSIGLWRSMSVRDRVVCSAGGEVRLVGGGNVPFPPLGRLVVARFPPTGPDRRIRSSCAGAIAATGCAHPIALGHATPNSEGLAGFQRVRTTSYEDWAHATDFLGARGPCFTRFPSLSFRVEENRTADTAAGCPHLPLPDFGARSREIQGLADEHEHHQSASGRDSGLIAQRPRDTA